MEVQIIVDRQKEFFKSKKTKESHVQRFQET